ncbi:MAG: EamA family transporter [Alphaproteobacteria bacterium]|nr:EamA family transporter [Alphaproteobacteria bacterium]
MTDTARTGALYGLTSAALFGASTPLAKLLLGAVDPWLLAGLLYLGSGIGLLSYRVAARTHAQAPLRRADLSWLAAAIIAGGVVGPVLLMIGLATTTASSAALLLNLEGMATMAIAWVVFRENFDRRILLGASAILAGAALLSWQGHGSDIGFGAVAIAGACLAWGIDNNLTRKVSGADPAQIAMLKGLTAGATNLVLALALGAPLPSVPVVAAAGLLGFFGYGVSLVLFVLALRHVGAARTGAYFSVAPFVGAALGVALLGDTVGWTLLIAGALMAGGVFLHVTERHEHEHVHEPMVHEHAHVHDEHHQHEHGPNDPIGEPHTHRHKHARLVHRHPHFPDLHHQHGHG